MTNEEKIKEEILKLLVEYAGRKANVLVDKIYRMITSPQISAIINFIHRELWEEMASNSLSETTIQRIHRLIHAYFNDITKVEVWMNTANPLLANQSPIVMMKEGREEKLLKVVENMIEGNNP